MRRFLTLTFGLLLLLAEVASAQYLAATSPVQPPSEARFRIRKIYQDATVSPVQTVVEISVQSSSDAELRYFNVVVPSTACGSLTSAAVETARRNSVGGEPAGVLASAQYRILDVLRTNGCGLPAGTLTN